MNYIESFCRIKPEGVWLNGKKCFVPQQKQFEINEFFSELYRFLKIDYRKFYKMDALSKLGFLASELLLNGIDREQPKSDMGILLFNRSSSLEADMNFQKTIQDKTDFFPSPAEFVYTLPNIVTGEIAIRNKILGETAFYVMQYLKMDVIIQTVEYTIYSTGMKSVLAGWVEVDAFKNTPDCLMMLCTPDKAKKDGLHLLPGFEKVYAGENIPLTMNNLYDFV